MKGLLTQEFYSLKTYIFFYTALNIVYGILFIPSQGAPTFISLAIGISISLVYRAVISDEATKWALFALTTKVKRKDYVLVKFLLLPLVTIGAALEAFIIIFICSLFNHSIGSAFDLVNLLTAEVTLSYLIIMGSIVLIFSFYLGFEKLLLILSVVILVVPVFLIEFFIPNPSILNPVFSNLGLIMGLLPIITAGIWTICYRISVKIFEKKDL